MIKSSNIQSKLAVSLCPLALAISLQTSAQEDSSGLTFLEEVIVTAQKRAQSVNDIGMSITAVNGDELEQLGVTDTSDLSFVVPGFTFAESGVSTPIYTIRGVGFSEVSVQAQSTVGVYNDQIAVPFPIMTSGLQLDMERVEVLKGPQGTLYGRNSTGGAVNYIANKPSDEFEASIKGEYGSFETFDLTGVVSAPLSDSAGVRFAIRTVQSGEGWQESVTRDDTLGEDDKLAARLLFEFNPSESLNINLAANYWEDNSDTQAPQLIAIDNQRTPADRPIVNALYLESAIPRVPLLGTDDNQAADWVGEGSIMPAPVADMSNTSFAATLEWAINDDMTLTSLTAFSEFENSSGYDYSAWGGIPIDTAIDDPMSPFNGITARDTIAGLVRSEYDDVTLLGGVGFTNDSSIDAFSQELRLDGSHGQLTWLAGLYYSQDEVDSVTPQIADFNTGTNTAAIFEFGGFPPLGIQRFRNISNQEAESWAVFAHSEFAASDAANVTLGLRYTEDSKDYRGCGGDSGAGETAQFFQASSPVPLGFGPGTCTMFDLDGVPRSDPYTDTLDEDSLSWRLGVDYDLNDDTLVYANYSRGFKSGSFPTLTANQWSAIQPVVQEQLDAYEIGFKTSLADNRLQLNGAAFYYDYKDKQLLTKIITVFGPANSLGNIPESTVTGAEFDISWYPTDALYLSLGATFIDTEVDDFTGYTQIGIEGDFSGSHFPFTPETQAFAVANYDFSLNENWKGFININARYSSESYADYEVANVVDSGSNGARYPEILVRGGATVGQPLGVDEAFVLPSSTIVGASIGITNADDTLGVTIWGRNITDEYSISNVFKTSDSIIGWTGRPTTYGISVNYNF
jgi:outer membrane receptor protein involved in Fe transport